MITLFIGCLFGLFLFYYLDLASSQRAIVARSQAWNSALGLAEAGVEEVLAHLNPGAGQGLINRGSEGWGGAAPGTYGPVTRTLDTGSYSVLFTDDPFPVIYSTGCVANASLPGTLTRVIRVTTTNAPLFSAAMAALLNIDFRGNGVNTDSFDSGNPSLSNDGRYDPTRTSTNGDVASVGGIINIGNGNINGDVLLGPTASDSINSQGTVSGSISNDFNVEFEDVVFPEMATWVPALPRNTTIDGVTYQYAFDSALSGDYVIMNLNGGIYVGTNTHVRLKLMGNATVQQIRVAGMGPEAGSLVIYMLGTSFTLSGNSTVDGGLAANLSYYGSPQNTLITFQGNASFTGTIYAPEARFVLGGGGSSVYDFVGACVVKSVAMNGHFNFHFDEALLRDGPKRPYVAASWREL